jgi:hypothetical protein
LASDAELNDVRASVARYTLEDSEDLESLIFIGKQEQNPEEHLATTGASLQSALLYAKRVENQEFVSRRESVS